MERLDWIWKGCMATGGAVTLWLFGGWTPLLSVLVLLVVADFLSGLSAAHVEGKKHTGMVLCSQKGYVGIAKKVGMFVIIAITHQLDGIVGSHSGLMDATIFFYIANELISIVENAGRMGLPLPPGTQKAIEVLTGKGDMDK